MIEAGLMHDADSLCERLGVNGTRPAIVAAAARVVTASAPRDMAGLRSAVREFEAVVRREADEAEREYERAEREAIGVFGGG